MSDAFSASYHDFLEGQYDCVDRIVINAYFPWAQKPGGFRAWWREVRGSDEHLDDTHLMRLAGRFGRRVRAFAKARGIPLVFCPAGTRKDELAQEDLGQHPQARGIFMILIGRAPAPVWQVKRNAQGVIPGIAHPKSPPYVNHFYFHIVDPNGGRLVIRMSAHPPFNAQILFNGHEYVASQAKKIGITFTQEQNCFTQASRLDELAHVAETLSEERTIGRLRRVSERWIYGCLCLALDSEDQQRSGFRYDYSVYQIEYSRNLLFQAGGVMNELFQAVIDRNRAAYDLKKFRAKNLARKIEGTRRYEILPQGLRALAALVVLRDKVIKPLLAASCHLKRGRKPKSPSPLDQHYDTLRTGMLGLFKELQIAA